MSEERVSRAQREAWARKYHTAVRTIDRWRVIGEQHDDPCPLDAPSKLLAWWTRRMSHTAPTKILRAARNAHRAQPATEPTAAPDHPPPTPQFTPIDISKFELGEGQDVTFIRQLIASLQDQIQREMMDGHEIDLLLQRHTKLVKALRERDRDDRQTRIHREKFIPRTEYERDAALAADMLHQMHESMARRIGEQCSFLTAPHRHAVIQAAIGVLAKQADVFRRLAQFESPADLLAELAAA